ncbi:hypothetical protein ACS0TY_002740 [Phlomoides rotata]
MEGLIPLLLRAVKKQRPQSAYRCLSENSTGRSYHLLLADDSSHGRTRSDSQQPIPAASDNSTFAKSFTVGGPATASPSNAENGLRNRRGFTSAAHYQVSARN